jgi:DNA processing protein
MIPDEDRAAYVALATIPGMSDTRLEALQQTCGSWNGALKAPFEFLCTVPGMTRAAATAVSQMQPAEGRRILDRCRELGAVALLPTDPGFPPALATISPAPCVLFALGRLELLDLPAVAVIGSRNHSAYGREIARMVAHGAAAAGIAVVSGMARGLDAVAHAAALDANGPTIGVLGNGLGIIYPAANRELYGRVARDGLLVTEFPPGERPNVWTFPQRNRIISGLARALVVIEAAEASGTLITVTNALDQGREVLAVPGPITSPTSIGTNRLLRDGATPLLELDDLLRLYPQSRQTTAPDRTPTAAPVPAGLDALAMALAGLCIDGPLPVDALIEQSGHPSAEVVSALAVLEILGVIEETDARHYQRVLVR